MVGVFVVKCAMEHVPIGTKKGTLLGLEVLAAVV